MIAGRDAEVAALSERAALVDRWEQEREARQAEMVALGGRLDAIASENRRLGEDRDESGAAVSRHESPSSPGRSGGSRRSSPR